MTKLSAVRDRSMKIRKASLDEFAGYGIECGVMAITGSERRRKLASCAKRQQNPVLSRVLLTVAREATDEELRAFDGFVQREQVRIRASAKEGVER